MGSHIVNGQFQSDKYPMCPPGKVPLSVTDKTAQDLLWEYATRRRALDAEFADDLEAALRLAGYVPERERHLVRGEHRSDCPYLVGSRPEASDCTCGLFTHLAKPAPPGEGGAP